MPTTNCEETFDRDTLPPIATFSILYILKKRYARERYGKKKYTQERGTVPIIYVYRFS